jgi:hypothetical protein
VPAGAVSRHSPRASLFDILCFHFGLGAIAREKEWFKSVNAPVLSVTVGRGRDSHPRVGTLRSSTNTYNQGVPIFMCRWPNGDLSFVFGHNKEDAIIMLDEWDNAELAELRQIRSRDTWMLSEFLTAAVFPMFTSYHDYRLPDLPPFSLPIETRIPLGIPHPRRCHLQQLQNRGNCRFIPGLTFQKGSLG